MIVLCHVLYVCACSQTLKCVYIIIYVMRKVRIRTILGFCCANLGSELCAIILGSRTRTSDPRISCANLGSARNHLGSRNQTPAIRGNNPQSIAHAKQLGHPRQRGFVAADGRAALRARSIVASLPRMAEVWLRDPRRLHTDPRFAQQKAALRARSIVGLLPQMAEVWLRDPRRLRADPSFAQNW